MSELERETMSDPQPYASEGVMEGEGGETEQVWDPNDETGT